MLPFFPIWFMHFPDRFQSLMYLHSDDYYSVHVVYYISKFKIHPCPTVLTTFA